MSFRPFQTTANGSFAAQPVSTGEYLIAVSSDASDLLTVTVNGDAGGATTENVSLTTSGRIERQTAAAFTTLTKLSTSGTLAGYLSLRGQGTAGVGDIRFTTIPTDGLQLVIGLVGQTQTYTYVCPAYFTLSTGTAASVTTIADSDYFDIAISGTTYRFWFEVDGAGGVAPSNPGVLTKVNILSTDTNALVATTLEASMESAITGYTCAVSSSTITVVKDILATATFTFTDGAAAAATGITYTLGDLGLADAANQIRTSYDTDGTVATATDVALWTQYAINATGGTAGTHYGTATAANAYVSASAASTTTTITDRLACSRNLGWTVTAPSGATARTVTGGANGQLLATLTSSNSIQTSQIFDNADLADDTLLGLWTGATDAILVNGVASTLRLAINNVTTAITAKIQASDDGTTYYDISGTTALTGTVAGTAAAYTLTGTSTLFTTELRVGDQITISTYTYTVASIASATSLAVTTPLVTSPSGTSATKLLPVQIASLDNNSQFVAMPPVQYARLNVTANANTTDSKLHAGLIL